MLGLFALTVVALVAAFVAGMLIPDQWVNNLVLIGHGVGPRGDWVIPPFPPGSTVLVYSRNGVASGTHFYLLGSDAGGRDLLALLARGAIPSMELVLAAVAGRFLVGIAAGLAMGLGSNLVRTLSRGMNRWFAGIPYLAFAIVLIQIFSGYSRFYAFVLAIALVGWREIADTTAAAVESVLSQPYAEASRGLGATRLGFFRLHVMPHLRPTLLLEAPFQASGVLVLLGELGYLNVYLGMRSFQILSGNPPVLTYRLPATPELGGLLAGARQYILEGQWGPVLMPALVLALLALSFELLGSALRSGSRQVVSSR
jgi:peptide/nickel transport system permease protein